MGVLKKKDQGRRRQRRKGDGHLSVKSKTTGRRVSAADAKERARRFGLRLQGASREGVVILLLAGCIFLLLALFSYQPTDLGWSHSGPETATRNWMGPVGAWLSDLLYSLFGASALWWPGMLGFSAWRLIRSRQVRFEWDATQLAVRIAGLILLLLGTTTLGAVHFFNPESELPYAAGGILGEGLRAALAPLIGSHGTTLMALVAILCGLPLFAGVSWLTILDEAGHQVQRLSGWLRRYLVEKRHVSSTRKAHAHARSGGHVQEPSPLSRTTYPSTWRKKAGKEPDTDSATGVASGSDGALTASPAPTAPEESQDSEIPWDMPARTPSAKRPGGGYVAASSQRFSQTNDETSAAGDIAPEPLLARGEEPALSEVSLRAERETSSHPETDLSSTAVAEGETVAATITEVTFRHDADSSRIEPSFNQPSPAEVEEPSIGSAASDIVRREPLVWPEGEERTSPTSADAAAQDSQDEDITPRQAEPRLPETAPSQAPSPVAPPEPSLPEADAIDGDSYAEDEEPSIAGAAQGRAAAAEPEGPTLWTVEHLQSQRPSSNTSSEPEGTLPSLRLLTPAEAHQPNYTPEQLESMAELLEVRLREYGVKAEVVETWPGPVITRFEIKPAAGVKVSKISNLAKDLARSLMVKSVRVVEIIPGRPTVGIEIPNPKRAMIRLREVIDSDSYQQLGSALTLALGQDIGGAPVVANLGKMPHLLVAGTTGSGKSVGVNAMLISMLLKGTPDEVRMIMVDPKMLELSVYDGIPHLLAPVVTDMKEAANALRWCVAEMERRYKLMAAMGVRNIAGFNAKLDEAERHGAQVADPLWEPQPWQMHEPPPVLEKLPYIVVVIDEFADMFMIVGKKVEELIARLAQKARAAGIHLILATQRPSVDVVTGLIKANIPTRMAFQVSSRVDSRTILDQGGAENLLGHGDMLYLPAGSGLPTRVHGAFVDDDEVHRVVEDWKRRGEPQYIEEILSGGVTADALTGLEAEGGEGDDAEQDALYDEAVMFVTESRRASISAVQRRFKIGYNRAARLVEAMEMAGVVSSMGTNGSREVLAPPPVGH
ncbi:DNA translocase FtsK 4TM domain-containing protein [Pistricoccus aurantiacus]